MAKGEVRIELNRQAADQLANEAAMERFVGKVADEIADEMERRAPDMVRRNGSFDSETARGRDGYEGRAIVKSPFWHWAEFGTSGRHFRVPVPFIKPAGQSVMSRYRGRWKTQ